MRQTVSADDAIARSRELIDRAQKGEEFLICRNGVPIAILQPGPAAQGNTVHRKARGKAKGEAGQ